MAKKTADEVQGDTGYTAPAPKVGTPGPRAGSGDRTVTPAPAASTEGTTTPKPKTGVGTSELNGSTTSSSSSTTTTTGGYTGTPPAVPDASLGEMPTVDHETVPDAPDLKPYLDQMQQAAQEQANRQIDYAVETGIRDLERAQEDAQPQFQQLRNQVDANEARALDNQALYAEARGDRGGIGQAQWNSIQNTAAQNRLQVQQQQTKMATDTARAIADLRAKGEFEKADKALELTQSYLSQLMQLEQWAASYNMDAAQFRESLKQFDAEFAMKWQQLVYEDAWNKYNAALDQYKMGWQMFTDQRDFDYTAGQAEQNRMAEAGYAMLSAGILPSESQLAAMGLTADQAKNYITAYNLSKSPGTSGPSRSPESNQPAGTPDEDPTEPDDDPNAPDANPNTNDPALVPITFGGKQYTNTYALLKAMVVQYGKDGVLDIPAQTMSDLSRVTQQFWGMSAEDTFAYFGYRTSGSNPEKGGGLVGRDGNSVDVTIRDTQFTDLNQLVRYVNDHYYDLTPDEKKYVAAKFRLLGYEDPWGGKYGGTGGMGTGAGNNGKPRINLTNGLM